MAILRSDAAWSERVAAPTGPVGETSPEQQKNHRPALHEPTGRNFPDSPRDHPSDKNKDHLKHDASTINDATPVANNSCNDDHNGDREGNLLYDLDDTHKEPPTEHTHEQ